MITRITLVVLLLFVLCPVGCYTFDRQHNRRHIEAREKTLQNFKTEFGYYIYNLERPMDAPQQTDRSIFKQMARDFRAAHAEWDYFINDLERDNYFDLP